MTTDIPNEATIQRLRGGPGVPFTDVTDKSGPVKLQWSTKAPKWRQAARGLCVEGKCENKRCKAHGHLVIMNKGYTEFHLINDAHTCQCPICGKGVVPITCGFNNCKWKVIGRKIDKLGQPPQMFRSDWKSAGDAYERFSPEKSGKTHFLDLKILCKEADGKQICTLCGGASVSAMKKARCGHAFHADRCFDLATDGNCIECMANQNRTSYQKLFG